MQSVERAPGLRHQSVAAGRQYRPGRGHRSRFGNRRWLVCDWQSQRRRGEITCRGDDANKPVPLFISYGRFGNHPGADAYAS